jgi:hypothetical protein
MFKEIIYVYAEKHMKPINRILEQNAELVNVTECGTFWYHCAIKG